MDKRRIIPVVLLAVCLVLLITAVTRLSTLQKELDRLEGKLLYLSDDIASTNRAVGSIYSNVEDILKKEASLVTSVDYDVEGLTEDGLARMVFKVIPKRITDTVSISVELDGQSADFTRDGNTFTASLGIDLFKNYGEYPTLIITDGDASETELLDTVDVTYLYNKFLPFVNAHLVGGVDHKQKTARLQGTLQLSVKPTSYDVTCTSAELVTLVNDKEVSRFDVSELIEKGELEINQKYTVSRGDKLELYVDVTDSLGYVHRDLAHLWYVQNGAHAEAVEDGSHIYDKNGNRLDN